MEITDAIIRKSAAKLPFGNFEPFVAGDDCAVASFYSDVLSALEKLSKIKVMRELDHQGSGYASYVSAFLYPSDGNSRRNFPDYIETTGILIYMSRLAPIAVYGASARTDSRDKQSSSSGFIGVENVGTLPSGDWTNFLATIEQCLQRFRVEFLSREPLLLPTPSDISIPTLFDGPHSIFDTLFYWSD